MWSLIKHSISNSNIEILVFILISLAMSSFSIAQTKSDKSEILEKEKSALNRWVNKDVWGYLNLFTEDATYVDTETKLILNGYEAIKSYILPWNGKIYVPSYKMENVDIKVEGNMGVLTFNVYNLDEKGDTTALWNSTEIYKKIKSDWKIIHSHWSIVKR